MKGGGKGGNKGGYQNSGYQSQGKGVSQSSGGQPPTCYNRGKSANIARHCLSPKVETRTCNLCGKKGHLAPQRRVPTREICEEETADIVWGACVIDEIQDVDIAGKVSNEMQEQKKKKELSNQKLASNPTWRKKIRGGYRVKFVLDSGAVKTIIPRTPSLA